MGGQPAEGPLPPRLQPPPPAFASCAGSWGAGPVDRHQESRFLTPLLTHEAALYYGTQHPPVPRFPLPTPGGAPLLWFQGLCHLRVGESLPAAPHLSEGPSSAHLVRKNEATCCGSPACGCAWS